MTAASAHAYRAGVSREAPDRPVPQAPQPGAFRWRPPRGHGGPWLPVAVGVIQLVGTYAAGTRQPDARPLDSWAVLLLLAGPLALLARVRHPVRVLLAAQVATVGYYGLGYPDGPVFLALAVALVGAVMRGHRSLPWLLVAVGLPATYLLEWTVSGSRPPIGELAWRAAWTCALLAGASLARSRAERFAAIRQRHEESARRQASEERLRLAQELHDVLAHNVSVINVQASTALHLFDQDPERARAALAAIKEASRNTLQELRATVGALRRADEQAPRAPTAGLARLDELVRQSADAGLAVTVERHGASRPLPPRVDLAAYRVVQEALTNARRHSGADRALVRLTYGPRDLAVEVVDAGRGPVAGADERVGHGLQGMRERAAALGGSFAAGSGPGGGWRVAAVLPLEADG
jgi:signal transduction histidine kinase